MEQQIVNQLQVIIDNQQMLLEAINFQSSCLIFLIVCFALAFIYRVVSNTLGDF
ncbi:MAG: hypothetical protein N4A64_11185 [Marinisporobacter sp.]|nr:hypothetical protein [Marinisporobacter sp.]